MGGIILTEEGREFCEKLVLEAYCNPETREEIKKIAECLGLDLEGLKDCFIKKKLDEEGKKAGLR